MRSAPADAATVKEVARLAADGGAECACLADAVAGLLSAAAAHDGSSVPADTTQRGQLAGRSGGNLRLAVAASPLQARSHAPLRHPNITVSSSCVTRHQYGVTRTATQLADVGVALSDVLRFSPDPIAPDHRIRFLLYQLCQALAHLHAADVHHGRVGLPSLYLSRDLTLQLEQPGASRPLLSRMVLPSWLQDQQQVTEMWRRRELSNFDYLLAVNLWARRRPGDPSFHPIMPWVVDFSVDIRRLLADEAAAAAGSHLCDMNGGSGSISTLVADAPRTDAGAGHRRRSISSGGVAHATTTDWVGVHLSSPGTEERGAFGPAQALIGTRSADVTAFLTPQKFDRRPDGLSSPSTGLSTPEGMYLPDSPPAAPAPPAPQLSPGAADVDGLSTPRRASPPASRRAPGIRWDDDANNSATPRHSRGVHPHHKPGGAAASQDEVASPPQSDPSVGRDAGALRVLLPPPLSPSSAPLLSPTSVSQPHAASCPPSCRLHDGTGAGGPSSLPGRHVHQQQTPASPGTAHVPLAGNVPPAGDVPPAEGWHDVTKSKHRAAKGDEQLDMMYSMSDVPHHISSEPLPELSYCLYKARRLPRSVLTTAVRANFDESEYSRSIADLYASTPDECIPEFFTDPCVFRSAFDRGSFCDLQLPEWASCPEEFIRLHRLALESDTVSSRLHRWLDLLFGCQLSGAAAVEAKNVYLQSLPEAGAGSGAGAAAASGMPTLRDHGVFQVFQQPHPPRLPAATACLPSATAGRPADRGACHAEQRPLLQQPADSDCGDSCTSSSSSSWVHVAEAGCADVAGPRGAACRTPDDLSPSRRPVLGGGGGGTPGRDQAAAVAAAAAVCPASTTEAPPAERTSGAAVAGQAGRAADPVAAVGGMARSSHRSTAAPLAQASPKHSVGGHADLDAVKVADQGGSAKGQRVVGQWWLQEKQQPAARRRDAFAGQYGEHYGGNWWHQERPAAAAAQPSAGPTSASPWPFSSPPQSVQPSVAVSPLAAPPAAAAPVAVPRIAHAPVLPVAVPPVAVPLVAVAPVAVTSPAMTPPPRPARCAVPLPAPSSAAQAVQAAVSAEPPSFRVPPISVTRDSPTAAGVCHDMSDQGDAQAHHLMREDVHMVGCMAVQLYRLRPALVSPAAHATWHALAQGLSDAPRRFVQRCLQQGVPCGSSTSLADVAPPGSSGVTGRDSAQQQQLAGRRPDLDSVRSAEDVLDDPFFTPSVRAAYRFLFPASQASPPQSSLTREMRRVSGTAQLGHAVQSSGTDELWSHSDLHSLAARVAVGELVRLRQVSHEALELCLPHIMGVLEQAAAAEAASGGHAWAGASGGGGAAATAAAAAAAAATAAAAAVGGAAALASSMSQVLRGVASVCSAQQARDYLLPFVRNTLLQHGHCMTTHAAAAPAATATAAAAATAGCAVAAALARAALTADLQLLLLQLLGPGPYCAMLLPLLLQQLLGRDASVRHRRAGEEAAVDEEEEEAAQGGATVSAAAVSAVVAVAVRLPLPVCLDLVVLPLLSVLSTAEAQGAVQAVPAALSGIAVGLGGTAAARHIAPVLLQMVLVPFPKGEASRSARVSRAPSTQELAACELASGPFNRSSSAARLATHSHGPFTSTPYPSTVRLATLSADDCYSVPLAPPGAQRDGIGHREGTAWRDGSVERRQLAALTVLEQLVGHLPREYLPRAFLCHASSPFYGALAPAAADVAGGSGGGDCGVLQSAGGAIGGCSQLLSLLLQPSRFVVAPGSLTRVAQIVIQAFSRLARPSNLAVVLVPHLLPLLTAPPPSRAEYSANAATVGATAARTRCYGARRDSSGWSDPPTLAEQLLMPASAAAAAAARAPGGGGAERSGEDVGYWQLVLAVYSGLLVASGAAAVRGLIPTWRHLEQELSFRFGWTAHPRRHTASGCAPGVEDGGVGGARTALADRRCRESTRAQLVSKQLQVLSLQSTHMFIKDVGWSVPNTTTAAAVAARAAPIRTVSMADAYAFRARGGSFSSASRPRPVPHAGDDHGHGGAFGDGNDSDGTGDDVDRPWGSDPSFKWRRSDSLPLLSHPLLAIGSPTVAEGLALALTPPPSPPPGEAAAAGQWMAQCIVRASCSSTSSTMATAGGAVVGKSGNVSADAVAGQGGRRLWRGAVPGSPSQQDSRRDSRQDNGWDGEHAPLLSPLDQCYSAAPDSSLLLPQDPSTASATRPPPFGSNTDDARRTAGTVAVGSTYGGSSSTQAGSSSSHVGGSGSSSSEQTVPSPFARLSTQRSDSVRSSAVDIHHHHHHHRRGGIDSVVISHHVDVGSLVPSELEMTPAALSLVPSSNIHDVAQAVRSLESHAAAEQESWSAVAAPCEIELTLPAPPVAWSSAPANLRLLSSDLHHHYDGTDDDRSSGRGGGGSSRGDHSGGGGSSTLWAGRRVGMRTVDNCVPYERDEDGGASEVGSAASSCRPQAASRRPSLLVAPGDKRRRGEAGGGNGAAADSKELWAWLPPLPMMMASSGDGGTGGSYGDAGGRARECWASGRVWAPPWDSWSLQAVHCWQAHRDRLRCVAVCPSEQWVMTAGRGGVGGRDAQVVRVWSLERLDASVSYTGHKSAVQAICFVPTTACAAPPPPASSSHSAPIGLAASLDVTGNLYIWSPASGKLHASFSSHGDPCLQALGRSDAASSCGTPSGLLRTRSYLAAVMGDASASPSSSSPGAPSASPHLWSPGAPAHPSSWTPAPAATHVGYTCMTPLLAQPGYLLAGTTDARVCLLNVETGCVESEWRTMAGSVMDAKDSIHVVCAASPPSLTDWQAAFQSTSASNPSSSTTSFSPPPHRTACPSCGCPAGPAGGHVTADWAAVGSRRGQVTVLDRRTGQAGQEGQAVQSWRAHGAELTCLAASQCGGMLVTASKDRTLCVWDMRCVGCGGGGRRSGCADTAGTSESCTLDHSSSCHAPLRAAPDLIARIANLRESVSSMQVTHESIILCAGSSVGVLPLSACTADACGGGYGGGGGSSSSFAEVSHNAGTLVSFSRVQNVRGGRDAAAVTGVGVLPACRYMVLGCEDGSVKLCR